MRIHRRSHIYVWLAVLTAGAIAAFIAGLLIWAVQVDATARKREQFLVGEGVRARAAEVGAVVTSITDWDEAVAHLDNRYDPDWTQANLTAYLVQNAGFQYIFVLDHRQRPIYASRDADVTGPAAYAPFAAPARPLIAQLQQAEARRGPIGKPAKGNKVLLSRSIQTSNFDIVGGRAYLITATLVQSDFGEHVVVHDHAPVVVTALPVDGAFTRLIESRFKLDGLRSRVGDRQDAANLSGHGQAVLQLATSDPDRPMVFGWTPQRPGAQLLRRSLPFVVMVLALIVGAGLLVVRRSNRIAVLLDASERETRTAAERLQMALSASHAGVFEIDYRARTFWCAPEFTELVGRPVRFDEVEGDVWPIVAPQDVVRIAGQIDSWRATLSPGVLEFRTRPLSGEARWIQLHAQLAMSDDGEAHKLTGLALDIDARKRQELALMAAEQAAQAAAEAKSQFLANMSHEIRTPMNGVLGVIQLLAREPMSADAKRLLEEADNCGRMLSQLLNDVIDVSKIEAGRLEMTPAALDPAELLGGVVQMLRPQAEAKGVALIDEASTDGGWILADPLRLRQALFNLIGNAVKFTAEGRVRARLSLDGDPQGPRRLRVEIEDTGIGIPEESQHLLFQRFQQADGSTLRRFGGSGLGLAITRAVVEMMGGEVGFSSVEGLGSTFWLDLPVEAAIRPAEPQEAADEAPSLEGLAVLVVEDNPTNRMVATLMLQSLGASVEVAVDGLEGVEAAQARRFDLILMDVQMPRLDGVGAARRIRAEGGPCAAVPIIALTANVLSHQHAQYLDAGMDGVAAKPIAIPDLLAEIGRVMGAAEEAAAA